MEILIKYRQKVSYKDFILCFTSCILTYRIDKSYFIHFTKRLSDELMKSIINSYRLRLNEIK